MKRLLILILCFFLTSISFSQQNKINPIAKASNSLLLNSNSLYNLVNINIGINIKMNNGDMHILGSYDYLTLFLYPFYKEFKKPKLNDHLLGLTMEYHFMSREKKVRPFIGLSFLSGIATNYRNGYLDESFLPTPNPLLADQWGFHPLGSHGGPPYEFNYNTNFYYSTPFLGNLLVGCDIRLAKGLRFSIAAGYGLRVIKYKNATWKVISNDLAHKEEVNAEELLKGKIVQNKAFHFMELQVGLSYTFSFHKKEKPQP